MLPLKGSPRFRQPHSAVAPATTKGEPHESEPLAPTYVLRLRAAPLDPIRSLRALLKFASQRLGLRALEVREERDPPGTHDEAPRQLDLFVTTPEERGPLAGLTVHLPDTCRCGTDVANAQTAIFRQLNLANPRSHHDALETS